MKYRVSGTHVHPDYVLNGAEFEVRQSHWGEVVKYYATNQKLGCSKDYSTAEHAVRALCNDHAIQVTKIVEVK